MEFKDYAQIIAILINLSGLLYVLKKTSREQLEKELVSIKNEIEKTKDKLSDTKESLNLLREKTTDHILLTRERFNKIDEIYKTSFEEIEENLSKMNNNQTWISDGMIKIAAKLSVDLEKRPLL